MTKKQHHVPQILADIQKITREITRSQDDEGDHTVSVELWHTWAPPLQTLNTPPPTATTARPSQPELRNPNACRSDAEILGAKLGGKGSAEGQSFQSIQPNFIAATL